VVEFIFSLKSSIRLSDLLDILIVAFIVYRALLLIKGTRAMQMVTGLGILGLGFFISSALEFSTTHWLLSHFFDYLILIVIVLFQDDLRRALAHVGKNPFFSSASEEEGRQRVEEIVRASMRLAKERIGALIVLERETGLKNFIDTGSNLDARVKSELLYSIFVKNSPVHDGAVIVTGERIAAAGCFLPLSKDPNIDKRFGSRHRAALGLTEDTDAVVVVVSEEVGAVHLVRDGRITVNLNEQELRQSLMSVLGIPIADSKIPSKLRGLLQLSKNFRSKKDHRGS
jgi:diadenylate cyclase